MTSLGSPAFKTLLFAGALAAAGTGYMLFEAQWLRLSRRSLPVSGLPAPLEGLKLLHISDLHAGVRGPNARALSKLAGMARSADPDLVLFTGDMTDKKRDLRPHLELLSGIGSRFGKFAVLGNHDHGLRKTVIQDLADRLLGNGHFAGKDRIADEEVDETVATSRRLLSEAGIQLLRNQCALVKAESESIQICGVDDYQYGYADMEGTAAQVDPKAALRILLSHCPDAVDHVSNGDYHILLAGHTHGGQICIPHPTRGKILLSTSGSSYGDGLYRFGNLNMHISRGVGTTLVPFRLLSRPEITLLQLTTA